jgi:hypothetical protein
MFYMESLEELSIVATDVESRELPLLDTNLTVGIDG